VSYIGHHTKYPTSPLGPAEILSQDTQKEESAAKKGRICDGTDHYGPPWVRVFWH